MALSPSLGRFGFAVVVFALCCQPATAQETLSEKFVARHKWTMSAPLGKPQPDCVETWSFGADGAMTVESGFESLTKSWRVGDDSGQAALFLRRMSSTGGADCLGMINDAFSDPDAREGSPLWLLSFNSGDTVLLCNPNYVVDKKSRKQTPLFDDQTCWGALVPSK
jgi:hypothetical protein